MKSTALILGLMVCLSACAQAENDSFDVGYVSPLSRPEDSVYESCYNYKVYIQDTYRQSRQEIIKESVSKWAAYTTIQLTFEVVDLATIESVQYTPGTIVVLNKRVNKDLLGWTSWDSDWAYVTFPDDYTNKVFRETAIHEFGHAFHLYDDPEEPQSVMCSATDSNPSVICTGMDVTCADLDRFCSRWNCRSPLMCFTGK